MQFFDISVVLLSRQWGLVFEFEIVNHCLDTKGSWKYNLFF